MYYVAAGFSYLVSILAPPSLAQLVGCVTIFSNSMFAGGAPVLKQLMQVRLYGVLFPLACRCHHSDRELTLSVPVSLV